jgi:hypothetical protein
MKEENALDLLPLVLMVAVQILHLYVSYLLIKLALEGIPWRIFGAL